MNRVKIKGEVVFVDEVKEYGANNFRKHLVVVKTGDERWENPIPVEFTKDNIDKSLALKEGQQVEIEGSVDGREWTGNDGVKKWFVNISGMEINYLSDSPAAAAAPASGEPDQPEAQPDHVVEDTSPTSAEEDDIF
jgi:single-stranded DNA-binding protein